LDSFELIAATSGAVPVAILLGLGYRPSEILRVLSLELPSILAHVPLLYGGNVGRWVRRWLYRPLSCRFTSAPRLELFRRLFGSAKMCDLHRHVLITAFRVDPTFPLPEEIQTIPEDQGRRRSMGANVHRNSWHPVLFSNLPRDCSGAGPDGSLTLVDAAMRATATPTYCPVYQVRSGGYRYGAFFR
jgi:patatin-like phospholipase/acyl hydrolase